MVSREEVGGGFRISQGAIRGGFGSDVIKVLIMGSRKGSRKPGFGVPKTWISGYPGIPGYLGIPEYVNIGSYLVILGHFGHFWSVFVCN